MSEDESPRKVGGRKACENDPNTSLVQKVRVRVSNIIPETFSKWFSPTRSTDSATNKNGNLRRKRNDSDFNANGNSSESEIEDEDLGARPPPKRPKIITTQISESYATRSEEDTQRKKRFLSSTPAVSHRQPISYLQHNTGTYNFTSPHSSPIAASIYEKRDLSIIDETPDADVLEVPVNQSISWRPATNDRKSLNIPSTSSSLQRRLPHFRRMSLKTARMTPDLPQGASESTEIDEIDLETTVDYENTTKGNNKVYNVKKSLHNGIRSSPNVLSIDTASESGESQCSSEQAQKKAGLIGSGSKQLRSSIGSGLNFATHLQGEKSLFSDKNMPNALNNSTISLTSLNRRQSFNASLYGSTSALSDSRLFNTASPFYKGRTTFGGASAYNKYAQHIRQTMRAPTLIRPTSSLSTLSTSSTSLAQVSEFAPPLSKTAERILDLINQCTTPLADAKKMLNTVKVPVITGQQKLVSDSDIISNRNARMSVSKTPYSRIPASSTSTRQSAPVTRELQVPSMSQLLQMKKLLQNNTETIRKTADSSKSILNKEAYELPTEKVNTGTVNKHINKIKNKTTSGNTQTLPPVNLPDIPLPQMKSYPKIDISLSSSPASSSTSNQSQKANLKSSEDQPDKSEAMMNKTDVVLRKDSEKYKYASPAASSTSTDIGNGRHHVLSKKNISKFTSFSTSESNKMSDLNSSEFKFSSPIIVDSYANINIAPINNFKFCAPDLESSLSPTKLSSAEFMYESQTSVKPKEYVANMPKAEVPKLKQTGSVLDVLKVPVTSEIGEPPTVSKGFGSKFKMPDNEWECSVCMIRNKSNCEKCVACGSMSPKSKNVLNDNLLSNTQADKKNSLSDLFKPSKNTWECSMCMVRNDINLTKCVACETENSSAKQSSSSHLKETPLKTFDAGFKNIVGTQSVQWECSACMTRNEKSRTKCICCEQAKPGAVTENVPQFSFGTTSNFSFGFGNKNESDLRKEENKTIETKVQSTATTSNTPANSNQLTFSFGIKPTLLKTADKDQSSTASVGGFKFGVPIETKKLEETKLPTTLNIGKLETVTKSEDLTFKPVTESSSIQFKGNDKKDVVDIKSVNEGSSIFKPIDGFAFGTNKLVTTDKKNTQLVNSPANDTTNKFSSGQSINMPVTMPISKPTFSFESSVSTSTFPIATVPELATVTKTTNANAMSIAASNTPAISTVAPASSFIFGKPATVVSATPSFGAVSSNAISSTSTASLLTTNLNPTNSSSIAKVGSTTTATTIQSFTNAVASNAINTFVKEFSASDNTTTTQPSNMFNIISPRTESSAPVFGGLPSMTNKPFAFGSNTANPATSTTSTAAPLVFGAGVKKISESTPSFATGNISANASSLPSFGSFSSPAINQTQQQGSSFSTQSPVVSPFANTNTNSNVPAFGSAPSNSTIFGSTPANFSNANSGFGSTNNPTFGSSSSFGSTFGTLQEQHQSEGPAAKKPSQGFNFGAPAQDTTASLFSFGSNNNISNNNNTSDNNKQPFTFSANTTPMFNFTSKNQETSSQPFLFGASPPASEVINIRDVKTAPNAPFQFNAATNTPAAANNPFAPTIGTPSTTQLNRRKIRTTTRRTQR